MGLILPVFDAHVHTYFSTLTYEFFRLGLMAAEEENPVSTSLPVSSAAVPDSQALISTIEATPSQPVQPIIPPVIPPMVSAVVPPIAPISTIPPPQVPAPLAPLPVRPPVFKPPVPAQNGEVRTSDSESDRDEPGPTRASAVEYEISEESRQVRERQEKAKQDLLMKRRAAVLAVPTNDMAVRARLRRLGEPITFFGEREMERRDRLRMLMAKLDSEGQLDRLMKALEEEEAAATATGADVEEEMLQYPFYTEGSKALLDARIDIAKYSIAKAAKRLQQAQRRRDNPDESIDEEIDYALKKVESLYLDCTESGDDRPLSGCSYSRDGNLLATRYLSLSVPQYIYITFLQTSITLQCSDYACHVKQCFVST